jgi:hypothetical protein
MGMATKPREWIGRVGILGSTLLAMVVVATPLAMWVSWTEGIFVGVIVVGLVAALLYCVVERGGAPAGRDPLGPSKTVSRLDDRMVKDLSDLQPFVYHNRGSAEARIRRTFDKVKEALEG